MHKDGNGNEYPVAHMDDSHLYNTIRYICKKIENARNKLDKDVSQLKKSELIMLGYDNTEEYLEKYKEELVLLTDNLGHYVLEYILRIGQEPIQTMIRNAIGREKGLFENKEDKDEIII